MKIAYNPARNTIKLARWCKMSVSYFASLKTKKVPTIFLCRTRKLGMGKICLVSKSIADWQRIGNFWNLWNLSSRIGNFWNIKKHILGTFEEKWCSLIKLASLNFNGDLTHHFFGLDDSRTMRIVFRCFLMPWELEFQFPVEEAVFLYGDGSKPISILVGWPSINPSYDLGFTISGLLTRVFLRCFRAGTGG